MDLYQPERAIRPAVQGRILGKLPHRSWRRRTSGKRVEGLVSLLSGWEGSRAVPTFGRHGESLPNGDLFAYDRLKPTRDQDGARYAKLLGKAIGFGQ